jgi:hypothetical protein
MLRWWSRLTSRGIGRGVLACEITSTLLGTYPSAVLFTALFLLPSLQPRTTSQLVGTDDACVQTETIPLSRLIGDMLMRGWERGAT